MYEMRPTFSGELEPVKVDILALGQKLQSSLRSLFEDEVKNLVVDVNSRPLLGRSSEWRLNVPTKLPKLYVALSELCSQANAFYREFVEIGTMQPTEFTVNVWCLTNNEESVKGSFD